VGDLARRFTPDAFSPLRRRTFEVRVGDVALGGSQPIRIQSMTTTDTQDVEATVAQAERLARAGCEIVRVTAPSLRDAECLRTIREKLRARGVAVPLVADIHFTPRAALLAADAVEKVRINPGNFADKKRFEVREYSDAEYRAELERVAERFRPLVRRCRENGVSMRIGTNHGSLSDRIMNRFGDTPAGMVESALEFLDVCEDEGFRDVVFSMKASNVQVAIQAYRLLAACLEERRPGEPSYPFHVGVTEAGDGDDGRVKSAIGIGSLLEDGIGDTIRVSLTEDPVKEVPVAAALARRCERRWREAEAARGRERRLGPDAAFVEDPFAFARRRSRPTGVGGVELGGEAPVRVELDPGPVAQEAPTLAARLATELALTDERPCEGLAVEARDEAELARAVALPAALAELGVTLPLALRVPARLAARALASGPARARPARLGVVVDAGTDDAALGAAARACAAAGVALEWSLRAGPHDVPAAVDRALAAGLAASAQAALFSVEAAAATHAVRACAARLGERGAGDVPLLLRHRRHAAEEEAALLDAAVDLGAPLCDGLGDAVSLAGFAPARAVDLTYRILQGSRRRTTRTEFISCPSCGRTLFDLEETTARIKERTAHLSGVKIAVMGCIVNGPGEMADADFGYVGSGPGRVSLYVGREVVARHVPEAEAPDRLVELIRDHGAWRDPS